MLLKAGGVRLPDGGASVRHTLEQEVRELAGLRERLGRVRMGAGSLGAVPKVPVSGQFKPIDNRATSDQLQEARKQKAALLKSLDFCGKLPDGGEMVRTKLEEVGQRIGRLEKEVGPCCSSVCSDLMVIVLGSFAA